MERHEREPKERAPNAPQPPPTPPTPSARMEPLEGDHFTFSCHPGVSCFGRCCSDLTLLLLPYDVLRLRRRLELGSRAFLDRYTDLVEDPGSQTPRVLMRMGDAPDKLCPFVRDGACTVYEDRPGACRMFPLGRAAARGTAGALGSGRACGAGVVERFFLVREPVCAGFDEAEQTWDVDAWIEDQDGRPFLEQNDAWLPIFSRLPGLARAPHAEQRFSVFFTAAYDLDRFCELVTGEAFTSRFEIPDSELGRIREDDEALLAFGVRWLRFALFGEHTMRF